jgi:hypothetical protein
MDSIALSVFTGLGAQWDCSNFDQNMFESLLFVDGINICKNTPIMSPSSDFKTEPVI